MFQNEQTKLNLKATLWKDVCVNTSVRYEKLLSLPEDSRVGSFPGKCVLLLNNVFKGSISLLALRRR